MNCPYCKFPSCYDSGFRVECANPQCKHYTLKQCETYITDEIKRRLLIVMGSNFKETPEPFPTVFTAATIPPAVVKLSWVQPDGREISRYFDLNESQPKKEN